MRVFFALGIVLAAIAAGARVYQIQWHPAPPVREGLGFRKRRAYWLPTLRKWAIAFGIPLLWLSAIVRVESSFDPHSSNCGPEVMARQGGAWGLGQVGRYTADSLIEHGAYPDGPLTQYPQVLKRWKATDPRSLLNPDLNLMLASFKIARLIRRYGRHFDLVSAAYHSGYKPVDRALAAGTRPPAFLGPNGRRTFLRYRAALNTERRSEPVA